jgi:glycosyltransferase involved in cell wall biosynthesis
MMRVTIIFDNFGPYHLARARAAAKRMEVTGVELRARSKTYSWETPGGADFRKVTLARVPGHGRAERRALTPHLEKALAESRPDVIAVNGWGDFLAPQSIRWCVRNKVPFVLLSESSALDGPSSSIRSLVKRRLVRMASAALVGGQPHREHVIGLGMAADRVFTGYNAVDNGYFAEESMKVRKSDGSKVGKYFLASNRFVERKNLARLIDAYAAYGRAATVGRAMDTPTGRDERESACGGPALRDDVGRPGGPSPPWDLCLLGDGELKSSLIAQCRALGLNVMEAAPWESFVISGTSASHSPSTPLAASVFFPGFRQISELPRFYAHAGCFIHPAMVEPWGLVVNEAMASGLPVLVSNRCGCARDLVESGVNGFTFDPEDAGELAGLLSKVAGNGFPLSAFASESRRIIARWAPEAFASGLESAAKRALECGSARSSRIDRLLLDCLCAVR